MKLSTKIRMIADSIEQKSDLADEKLAKQLNKIADEKDYDYRVIDVHQDNGSILIETSFRTFSVAKQLKLALAHLGYTVKKMNRYLAGDYVNYEAVL